MSALKAVVLSENEFKSLREGGFFNLVLDHPRVQVYFQDDSICIHIPDHGMVQIAVRKDEEKGSPNA